MGKIKPLNDIVLIQMIDDEPKKTEAGIFLPDTGKQKSVFKARVIAAGPGTESTPMPVKAGDVVLVPARGITTVEVDGEEYGAITQSSLICVIE